MKSSERVPQRVPVMDEGRSSYVHFVQRKMMNGPCRQEALEFRTEDNNTATDRVNSYGEDETKQCSRISCEIIRPRERRPRRSKRDEERIRRSLTKHSGRGSQRPPLYVPPPSHGPPPLHLSLLLPLALIAAAIIFRSMPIERKKRESSRRARSPLGKVSWATREEGLGGVFN